MAAIPHATARKGSGGGFLVGMFVGLLVGLAVALGIALYLNKTPIPFMSRSKPAPEDGKGAGGKPPALTGLPQGGTAQKPAAPVPAVTTPEKPRFDFYKILAGGEEPLSDRELRERLKAAKTPPPAQTAAAAPAESRDIYFIQAGAFQNPADADNQKARLAMLGFESNVEPTNLPDKGTFYRVRLGPYAKVEDLNRVRQSLAQNGIDANLVKLKDPASRKVN
ncbi:MAG: SPOR domain-containing protein [Betaproteobacteria bacterium]|nr:SPOR domain-containing protein [Betaproteobacteria bacterium]